MPIILFMQECTLRIFTIGLDSCTGWDEPDSHQKILLKVNPNPTKQISSSRNRTRIQSTLTRTRNIQTINSYFNTVVEKLFTILPLISVLYLLCQNVHVYIN